MERSSCGARKEQQVPIGVFDHERLGPPGSFMRGRQNVTPAA